MEPFLERLYDEKKELDNKRIKLSAFLGSQKPNETKVSPIQIVLLRQQFSIMTMYSECLQERIDDINNLS